MNKAAGCLGMAIRAKRVTTGEVLFKSFAKGGIRLVIMVDNIGENTKKKLIDKCTFYDIPYVYMQAEDMESVLANRKYVGIQDNGFAKQLITCLKG